MAVAGVEAQAEQSSGGFFRTESRARTFVLAAMLVAITVAVYLPVHNQPFFNVDDNYYVVENENIHQLNWTTVEWAFTSTNRANWIPLSFLSYAVEWQLFGDNPAGYHEVNLLLHALSAALLFWVLKRGTGYIGRSFMVAALFALHPMNVEAVAWIAERKTVLSMLFFLLALGAYQWYAQCPVAAPGTPGAKDRERRYWLVALCYALGLAAKAQVITLPAVLLLWDYWPLQRLSLGQPPSPEAKLAPLRQDSLGTLIKEKIPLLLFAVFAALMTVRSENGAHGKVWAPLSQRLANAIYSYWIYIAKTFWPTSMAPMYPNRGAYLGGLQVAGATILLLAITALVIVGRRRRYLPVGWFWFLGTLVPMLQLFQFGFEGMADRFAYQALIGLFIIVCWGVSDLAAQRQRSTTWLAGAGAVVLIALTLVTHQQINFWKDPATMWEHALETVPGHWFAEREVGKELMRRGDTGEALVHFRRAITINPFDGASNISLALYDQQHGNLQDAVVRYQAALQDYSLLSQDVAILYKNMGIAYRQLGDTAKAEECFQKAAELSSK